MKPWRPSVDELPGEWRWGPISLKRLVLCIATYWNYWSPLTLTVTSRFGNLASTGGTLLKTKRSHELLKSGELAQQTGVTLRTIRYYQSLGLIEAARRTRGGLHLYATETCDRIQFIRDLRSLDISLTGIRAMLERRRLARTGAEGARDVVAALTASLRDLEKRLQQFQVLRQEMTEALGVLETCLRCPTRPLREACYTCENLTRRDRVPTYIRAMVN